MLTNVSAKTISHLYLLNSALLTTHEIDSAYWHEWELFHLPGGITFFLIVNFVLLWVVLYGFSQVIIGATVARWFSYGLAAAGIFAFTIHSVFLAIGHDQFRTPVSLGLLIVILLVSLSQGIVTGSSGRNGRFSKRN